MDVYERNQAVVDIISAWLLDQDAYYLAKENEVVYWTSITDDAADGKWHRMTAAEVARILKATVMHYSIMAQCTSDAVITAAQETGRAYIQGVKSNNVVKPEYFNYFEHEVLTKGDRHDIATRIIMAFKIEVVNPSYAMVIEMVESAWRKAEQPKVSPVVRNRILKEVSNSLGYKVCRYGQRYNCSIHGKQSVLKLDAVRFATMEWPDDKKLSIIENALRK